MKIKVTSVSDDSFNGKDGRVLAAKLTYTDENGSNTLPGYGPSMAQVLKWQAGEEQEIETYTTRSGKAAFRLPNSSGGRGGGAGFAAAYRNTKEGHAAEQERMDRRTALMQAVAFGADGINAVASAAGGVRAEVRIAAVVEVADKMYDWLRKTAGN